MSTFMFLTLTESILQTSYLFELEDVLVEVMLETFVGKVDAELFEAVVLIVLETKNVKHSNGQDLREKPNICLF